MKLVILTAILVLATGCIHQPGRRFSDPDHPGASAPPANPAKWASCESLRSKHNTLLALGTIFGVLGGLGGLAGDVPTTAEKLAVGGGGGLLAGIGALLGTFAGFDGDDYARANCSNETPP